MNRLIVIGDVHGCLAELNELIEKLCLSQTDTLVFAGDLVHKGPDSCGVVRRVMGLRPCVRNLVVVRGNHEDSAIKHRGRADIGLELSNDEWQFLGGAPLWYRDAGRGVLVVHGGIPKDLHELPEDPDSIWALSNSKRKLFDRLCRMRYVDAQTGDFVALNARKPDDPFWAHGYDGRLGFVVFGHEPFHTKSDLAEFDHAVGVDLGCVQGNRLAAAVFLDPNNLTYTSVCVRARDMYVPPLDID